MLQSSREEYLVVLVFGELPRIDGPQRHRQVGWAPRHVAGVHGMFARCEQTTSIQ